MSCIGLEISTSLGVFYGLPGHDNGLLVLNNKASSSHPWRLADITIFSNKVSAEILGNHYADFFGNSDNTGLSGSRRCTTLPDNWGIYWLRCCWSTSSKTEYIDFTERCISMVRNIILRVLLPLKA
jgi:hypothetical protein